MAAWIPEKLLALSPSAGSAARLRRQSVPNPLAARSPELAAASEQVACKTFFRSYCGSADPTHPVELSDRDNNRK